MLDRGAAGAGRSPRTLRAMRVDDGPEPLRGRLAAGGLELFRAEGGRAAIADAGRREDLDDVGPLAGTVAHELPHRRRIAESGRHAPERRQDPWAGNITARDPIPQLGVGAGAETLHRGHAAHQRRPGVLDAVQHDLAVGLFRVARVKLPIGVEMPPDVDVGVDQPRQHSEASEVVDGIRRGRRCARDLGDQASPHDDALVGEGGAPPVERARRLQDDRLLR